MSMAKWNVLVTAPRACSEFPRYRDALEAAGCRVTMRKTVERLTEVELLPLVGEVDGIVCGDDRITAAVMAAAPRLKVIAKWGTGIDGIDLEYAAAHGIAVRNTPDAFTEPVADTVLGYMLMFARGLDRMALDMRAGLWRRQPLKALRECTVGIIGFGNIGRAVARRCGSFGMRTLVNDLHPIPDRVLAEFGVTSVPLPALMAQSDFVTLHANLHAGNRHFIDAGLLRLMGADAVLINTARGPLVEEGALVDALASGQIGGAALDVFEDEPLPPGHPLRSMPNVYLAPHNANASPAAAERVHLNTIENLIQALRASAS
jgi:D-3-phosphoglycerate dehydrogenase